VDAVTSRATVLRSTPKEITSVTQYFDGDRLHPWLCLGTPSINARLGLRRTSDNEELWLASNGFDQLATSMRTPLFVPDGVEISLRNASGPLQNALTRSANWLSGRPNPPSIVSWLLAGSEHTQNLETNVGPNNGNPPPGHPWLLILWGGNQILRKYDVSGTNVTGYVRAATSQYGGFATGDQGRAGYEPLLVSDDETVTIELDAPASSTRGVSAFWLSHL
jgi:hypothetical protein